MAALRVWFRFLVRPLRRGGPFFRRVGVWTPQSELSQKVVDIRSSPDTPPHIGVIGPMIEQMEEGMRTSIERVYLAKAYAVSLSSLRVKTGRNTTPTAVMELLEP